MYADLNEQSHRNCECQQPPVALPVEVSCEKREQRHQIVGSRNHGILINEEKRSSDQIADESRHRRQKDQNSDSSHPKDAAEISEGGMRHMEEMNERPQDRVPE